MFGEELELELDKARKKYLPLEEDATLSKAEKEMYMLDWWRITQDLLVRAKITKEQFRVSLAY